VDGPLGIAGVMGGAGSEITASTSSVIVESAIFDPVSIRRTGQRYGLRSEASLRFEKGQEHRLARIGADRTVQLIGAWGGGRVARGVVDTDPRELEPSRIPFRPERTRRLLGVDVPASEQRALLERVGIATDATTDGDEQLVAIVPEHRRDIAAEADLIEEIVRVRGYETVPATLPTTAPPGYRPDPRGGVERVRDLLAGRGLNEVITHALIGPEDHAHLGLARDDPATIRASNPVSIEHSQLRRSLLPGLLGVLVHNERQRRTDVALFEIGAVHRFEAQRPVETLQLGVLLAGDWIEGAWDQTARRAEIADVVGLCAALAERLKAGRLESGPKEHWPGVEHPGRVASLRQAGGADIGAVGELDPRLLDAVGARAASAVFATLDLGLLLGAIPATQRGIPLPRSPAAERDIAVVVGAAVPVGDVTAAIRDAAGSVLREVRLFDRYRGAPLAPSEISLAFRLRLQGDQTLTDAEIEAVLERVVAALGTTFGARLRS
jgi:phenylalanyl-tRNA synthetase beta chain